MRTRLHETPPFERPFLPSDRVPILPPGAGGVDSQIYVPTRILASTASGSSPLAVTV